MVEFRPFDDLGDPGFASLVPTARQTTHVRNQLVHVQDYLDSLSVRHNIGFFLKVFKRTLDTTLLYRSIPCYYGWCVARIDLDGMVYPCCRCYQPLGNAYEDGLRQVWHGEAYRRFRREALAISNREAPVSGCECTRCVHHTANLRIHRALHPIRWREAQLEGSGGRTRARI
jgi:MoaA/NifB/PqqE/SkfB family radical SAM enzyme